MMKYYSFLIESDNTLNYKQIVQQVYNLNKDSLSNNCQKFAIGFELMCRGISFKFNKTETPIDRIFDTQYGFKHGFDNYNVFLNTSNINEVHNVKSYKEIYNQLLKLDDDTRYIVRLQWINNRGGHIFNCVKFKDEVYLCDSMSKIYGKFMDVMNKYPKSSSGFYMRVDNKNYNKVLLNELKDTTKKIYSFDEDLDDKYSSILEFLDKNGKENTIFKVYKNNKEYGRIKCLNISKQYKQGKKIWWTVWNFDWV